MTLKEMNEHDIQRNLIRDLEQNSNGIAFKLNCLKHEQQDKSPCLPKYLHYTKDGL